VEQRREGARGVLAIEKGAIIKLSLAALVLIAAVVIVWRWMGASSGGGEDGERYDETKTRWLCLEAACKAGFVLSTAELGKFYSEHEDQNPPCPACEKQNTARASRCEACKKLYVPKHEPPAAGQKPKAQVCPNCGKPVK